jgi:hypothetical protein
MDIVMRILIGVIAAASVGLWSSAQAVEPPVSTAPQSTSAPQTQAPADASKPAATTDSTSSAAQNTPANLSTSNVKLTAGDSEAAAQLKRFKAAGYKPEVHDGQVVFCRNETVMGSRFDKKVCTTAHLLEQQMAQAQDTLATSQRNGTLSPRSN